MPCCFFPKESPEDYAAHHVQHKFFEVGLAHDVNIAHRKTMEDAHVVKVPFLGEEGCGFFAIYDGHGGNEASSAVAEQFHGILEHEVRSKPGPKINFKECFENAYARMDDQLKTVATDRGATSATCMVRSEADSLKLYVANAGDARAILCRDGQALRLTYDHKPSDEGEKKRIEEGGAFVTRDRVNGMLGVSRAFGDHLMKKWVISNPAFWEGALTPRDSFIIIACDGVWDVIQDQDAVNLALQEKSAQRICEKLVKEALAKNTTDNVSVMAVRFRWENRPTGITKVV